jgi:hypothetical protein
MVSKARGLEDMINESNEAKILTIDIETSPNRGTFWGNTYETSIIEIEEFGKIIGFSAKWLNGPQLTRGLIDYKGYKPNKLNDTYILKDIHKLLDTADIVVGQNSIAFDIKYINQRFLLANMTPPSPYKQVDTKNEARKIMRLPSNKLDNLGRYFNIGHKLEHEGYDLWKKCIAGNKKAWDTMKKYNAQDTLLTEKIYLKLRPFMKSHPNVTLYSETNGCPKCGYKDTWKRGYYVLTSGKYSRYSCNNCGSWYRAGSPEKLSNQKTKGTSI